MPVRPRPLAGRPGVAEATTGRSVRGRSPGPRIDGRMNWMHGVFALKKILIACCSLFGTTESAAEHIRLLGRESFAGKAVIPFCTHGGGGLGLIQEDA